MSIVSPVLSLRQQQYTDNNNNSTDHRNNTKENAIANGYNETHRTVDAVASDVSEAGMATSGLTKEVYTENQTTRTSSNSRSSKGSAENEQQVSLQTIIILLVMGIVVVVYCSKCVFFTHVSQAFFLTMCADCGVAEQSENIYQIYTYIY